ncbi:MAG: Stp1/IreP family PP2C-type Ser/Thr phosphatase [Oscillospiraceae bacterium]|nr:Stp1/IreP family PP2C-type Ser/Thr phosphatase [Oscillospiraceae bacterium]
MDFYGLTDRGIVRKQNQDTFACQELRIMDGALIVVCDGMGGARGGNIASRMTCDTFCSSFLESIDPFDDLQALAGHMKQALEQANEAVFARSGEDPECSGMGTTLVAAAVTPQGAAVLNIGDSRAYHISRTGGIRQITRDHSVVADMVERGEIRAEEARTNPNRNLITRAVGTAETVPGDFFFVPMREEDILLLCSDGLTNLLEDDELAAVILQQTDLPEGCERLIREALTKGAPDNVTAVLLKM